MVKSPRWEIWPYRLKKKKKSSVHLSFDTQIPYLEIYPVRCTCLPKK